MGEQENKKSLNMIAEMGEQENKKCKNERGDGREKNVKIE
jgi:hypothetical protein